MHVIPVIDLKNGQVVRGVGGQRADYLAIQSQLVAGAKPGDVAQALRQHLQLDRIYVADLDAIAGQVPDWHAYREIFSAKTSLLIDAGIATPADAAEMVDFSQGQEDGGLVVALESTGSPAALRQVFAKIGVQRAVFSLDLKHGQPLTSGEGWCGLAATDIAECALEIGFRRMIILDLAAVGLDAGPLVLDLCAQIRAKHPSLELISGGGVRSTDDLRRFHQAGCDGVLVASALHDGRITRAELEKCRFLND